MKAASEAQDASSVAAITLDELARDPKRIGELTRAEVGTLLVRLSALSLALASRLATSTADAASNDADGAPGPDRLLDVNEAAKIIGMSATTLYRNKDRYPFFVRNGHQVRFSGNGIAKWISRRAGR